MNRTAFAGLYVYIDVEGVPKDILEKVRDSGFVSCFSLLQHENKLSVLHFNIRKSSAITVNGEETTMAIDNKQEENVIKSKDKLLFMVS